MTGIHVLIHSIQMVLRNFLVIIKLGLVPFVAMTGLFYALLANAGESPSPTLIIVFVLTGLFVMMMIAVNWHRFVLLEEYPSGWLPSVHTARVFSYIGTSFLIGLILGLVGMPVLMLLTGALAGGDVTGIGAVIVLFAVSMIGIFLFYRLALILPASAIGKPLKIKEAFAATRGASGDIIVLAVANAVLQFALQQGGAILIGAGFPILGSVWVAAASIVLPVLNLSILTTLYGHYVEGRPISY